MNKNNAARLLAWLVATGCIFIGLGKLPLLDPDEGRNAEVAREMKDAGSYVIPLYDGMPYLDKPAFYFDAVAASFKLFGENEGAARLPSALFGSFTLALVYFFCRYTYGARAAALGVLVGGTSPLFIAFSRIVIFDMALTFFVCAALFAGYMGLEQAGEATSKRWFLLTALFMALAVLVKGPVGFVLPALGLLVYAKSGGVKGGRRFFASVNVVVFFAIVLGWFVAVLWKRPDFAYYGIVKESLGRFTSAAEFHRSAPVYYYIPVLAAVFFPWSTLLPEMLARGWQARSRAAHADRLLACFALVVVIFFSISRSKLPGYVLPGVVALGMLTARVFDRAMAEPCGAAARLVQRGCLLLAVTCGVVGGLLAANQFHLLALERLFHIRSKQFANAQVVLPPLLITLLVIAVAALAARACRSITAMLAVYALMPVLLLTVSAKQLSAYAEQASSRKLAESVREHAPPGAEVACYQCFAPGLPFYLKQNVIVITEQGRETTSNYIAFTLEKSARWPEQAVRLKDAASWVETRTHPVLLISRVAGTTANLTTPNGGTMNLTTQELASGWWGTLVAGQGSR
jgi:4-amino-4-deoxy-L-arabinose transferase-like glycosyltransferase